MTNLYDGLVGAPPAAPDCEFLRTVSGESLSYAQFHELTGSLANTIAATGARPGDRLIMQVAKSPTALALYLATVRAGLIFIPLNPAYGKAELEYLVSDAQPSVVIVDPKSPMAEPGFPLPSGCAKLTVDVTGRGSLTEGPQNPDFQTVSSAANTIAAILYTSGTTGKPKGAMLTHDNLLSNAVALKQAWDISGDDVLLHALPIFHTHGLFVATNTTLLAGARMVFLEKFENDAVFTHLPKASMMMGVPTFYSRMLTDQRLTNSACRQIRLFISGSAPLSSETFASFEKRSGHAILERYGMTETNMITSNPLRGERRAGTVGRPLPGVSVRVVDEAGGAVRPGQVGGIEVKGPNVFKGYWQNPEKTALEFREDGFFVTGDMGRFDSEGYLEIVGRSKDLVISGGLNVYPKEIEDYIESLKGVLESAVFGVPHPDFGEAVVAAVVIADGETSSEEILSRSRENLANFKAPKAVFVFDELPRNAMGKIEKARLREKFNKQFDDHLGTTNL